MAIGGVVDGYRLWLQSCTIVGVTMTTIMVVNISCAILETWVTTMYLSYRIALMQGRTIMRIMVVSFMTSPGIKIAFE